MGVVGLFFLLLLNKIIFLNNFRLNAERRDSKLYTEKFQCVPEVGSFKIPLKISISKLFEKINHL